MVVLLDQAPEGAQSYLWLLFYGLFRRRLLIQSHIVFVFEELAALYLSRKILFFLFPLSQIFIHFLFKKFLLRKLHLFKFYYPSLEIWNLSGTFYVVLIIMFDICMVLLISRFIYDQTVILHLIYIIDKKFEMTTKYHQ